MANHWPIELRKRIEAAGFYTLTTLGILFRKIAESDELHGG